MRTKKRSNQQLRRTSATRALVFEFMSRFPSQHQWTIDGPPDAAIDEIMCFAYDDGGPVFVTTWWYGGWTLLTEPSVATDLDILERAMRLQIEERQRGTDAPLSPMRISRLLLGMLPRMSDQVIDQCFAIFHGAASDRQTMGWRERNKEVRIPVEGMTPSGFVEPGARVYIKNSFSISRPSVVPSGICEWPAKPSPA